MSDIIWGDRKVGSTAAVNEEEGLVILADVPDWVRTPPELGSTQLRVIKAYMRSCPCGGSHQSKTFDLEGDKLHVSECHARGFLWWK